MAQAAAEFTSEQATESLPRGLRWRGDVLWINKKINGKRFQLSTGCKDLTQGMIAFEEFLLQHGVKKSPGSGRRINTDRPELPKGLYWKGNVIWLSRSVDGKHYNVSTGTPDPKLAAQFLANFDLKAFKGEKLGVLTKPQITFEQIATRYLEQGALNGLRPRTIARYKEISSNFSKFLNVRGLGSEDARKIAPSLIEDYKVWRSATALNREALSRDDGSYAVVPGAAPKTLQLEMRSISSFFKHAVRLRLIDENPVAAVRPVAIVLGVFNQASNSSGQQQRSKFSVLAELGFHGAVHHVIFHRVPVRPNRLVAIPSESRRIHRGWRRSNLLPVRLLQKFLRLEKMLRRRPNLAVDRNRIRSEVGELAVWIVDAIKVNRFHDTHSSKLNPFFAKRRYFFSSNRYSRAARCDTSCSISSVS